MSPFKRYSYLLTAAFFVVILVSLSFLGIQFQADYQHEQTIIQSKFSENAINLDSTVKSVIDQLHILQANAEEGIVQLTEQPVGRLPLKGFDKDGEQRYRLPPKALNSAITFSNFQGIGNFDDLSDALKREITMAIRLTPGFRSIRENLEEITWAYYISARKFMNVYPYDEGFEYPEEMYEMQFFTQALPENNLQRKTSWTDAYLDLAGQGMMVTADAPVYEGDQFRGIVAIDITLQRLNQVIQNFDYPNGKILISDDNQQLLAVSNLDIKDLEETQTLNDILPLKLGGQIDAIFSSSNSQLKTIGPYFVIHRKIQNTPWHLVFYVPKQAIYFAIINHSLLASLIPLLGLGLCLLVANRLLNYGFIQPACQLVDHIEQEKQSLTPQISTDLPDIWVPWFESISNAFQENRILLKTLEDQLDALKAAQLQLVQSEKMSALGNLVAGVAHEINNPVGFVSGNVAELKLSLKDLTEYIQLLEETSNPEIVQAREDLEIEFLLDDLPNMIASMEAGCDRICNISQSLRLFTRSDDDKMLSANVHDGINSALLILKYRLKANEHRPEIQVIQDYEQGLPEIICYPGQLSQVFMNILANAIDMFDELAEEKSFDNLQSLLMQIKISTQINKHQQVEIRIKDNGTGIPEDICAKIFDRQFTTKTVGKGTGLGLAISHQVITQKHSGFLDVHSQLGHGTEFLILLPVESTTDPQTEFPK
ncbi:MAG: hypothetical protein KTR27_20590 [Leptolyngbyaceae cyanobacterium MAG.088]|nr:hypothetical protein [Leptolyngbyaceae cyanobacterium MAG.088]